VSWKREWKWSMMKGVYRTGAKKSKERRKNLKQSSKVIAGNVIRDHFLSVLFRSVFCYFFSFFFFFILSRDNLIIQNEKKKKKKKLKWKLRVSCGGIIHPGPVFSSGRESEKWSEHLVNVYQRSFGWFIISCNWRRRKRRRRRKKGKKWKEQEILC
jgi:hypothetical protein